MNLFMPNANQPSFPTSQEHHRMAMSYADLAFKNPKISHLGSTRLMLNQAALHHELEAIYKLPLQEQSSITWFVLHRSAATLALDCEQLDMAVMIASNALASARNDTPQALMDELHQVLTQAKKRQETFQARSTTSVGAEHMTAAMPRK